MHKITRNPTWLEDAIRDRLLLLHDGNRNAIDEENLEEAFILREHLEIIRMRNDTKNETIH